MYQKMGVIDAGIEIVRSGSPAFRQVAAELDKDYFADVEYQGELVRAQMLDGRLQLHEAEVNIPFCPNKKLQNCKSRPLGTAALLGCSP